jgi:hypothetical protein
MKDNVARARKATLGGMAIDRLKIQLATMKGDVQLALQLGQQTAGERVVSEQD